MVLLWIWVFAGNKFRKQHSFGNYAAEFYCPELKLIIESDGEPNADLMIVVRYKEFGEFSLPGKL
jgi:very-short-patch-repair endonuclease